MICLAAVSGYIRADEATKGYYTKRLRLLAAAAVGASGVLIYQIAHVVPLDLLREQDRQPFGGAGTIDEV